METLLLVRHGETLANKNQLYLGRSESPLSEEGKRQAQCLEAFLRNEPLDAIYTSTSLRTLETVEGLAYKKGLPIYQEEAFCEIDFGEFEGKDFKTIQQTTPQEVQKMLEEGEAYTFPGGESLRTSYARHIKGLEAICKLPQKTILLCAHGGTLRDCISYLIGGSPALHWHFKIEPGSLTRFSFQGDFAVCEGLNQTAYYK